MLDHASTVDRARVLGRLDEISRIGALDNGGVCRLALSPEETQAKAKLISWAQDLGCVAFADDIGNVFLRFEAGQSDAPAVLVGSHLDTQPVGGNYDGVLGVIAALECVEVISRSRLSLRRPVEIVIWCNEEGARFNPTTMGSAVHAGHLSLVQALAVVDENGDSVRISLDKAMASLQAAGFKMARRELAARYDAYVELHIEQGPILENKGITIGVVTDVQGLTQYRVEVTGVAGHAGAVPMQGRDDALTKAREIMTKLDERLGSIEGLRFTIGRLDVAPGAINTIPARATFTLDARHPDPIVLKNASAEIEAVCGRALVSQLIYQAPVPFDPFVVDIVETTARDQGFETLRLVSGATHDAAQMAAQCPCGMIFVPCHKGISHNENEYCAPEHVIDGTRILVETVLALAGRAGA
ncbi:M20 family metallo-hydrolase [Brucella intermedia]|uniref:M20 family metallo-hydrolase n=1 Tax=Brucella intermedia TaxID=94625 RepID=UPI002249897D|nr:M20 family metallo-hydrolase [Brucella intermedia]